MKMNKLTMLLGVLFVMLFAPLLVFAQDAAAVTDMDVIKKILELVTTKGAGTLAVILGVVQAIMLALQAPSIQKLFKIDGGVKLALVSILSVVASVVAAAIAKEPIAQALLSGANLAALQVFAHQLYIYIANKKKA